MSVILTPPRLRQGVHAAGPVPQEGAAVRLQRADGAPGGRFPVRLRAGVGGPVHQLPEAVRPHEQSD